MNRAKTTSKMSNAGQARPSQNQVGLGLKERHFWKLSISPPWPQEAHLNSSIPIAPACEENWVQPCSVFSTSLLRIFEIDIISVPWPFWRVRLCVWRAVNWNKHQEARHDTIFTIFFELCFRISSTFRLFLSILIIVLAMMSDKTLGSKFKSFLHLVCNAQTFRYKFDLNAFVVWKFLYTMAWWSVHHNVVSI